MKLFVHFSLAILAYADVPACPNGIMSFNYSKLPVVFPSGGDLQTFPDFYNCQLQISVPLGYFVIFKLDLNSANPDPSTPQNRPQDILYMSVYSVSQSQIFYFHSTDSNISTHIAHTTNSQTLQDLRGLIFFNGPYWNSTILGTGRQIFHRKSQFVTSSSYNKHYLTVLFLGNSAETDIQFVEQLYENTQQFTEIQTLVYNGNITRELTMETSGNAKSIVQTYSDYLVVEGILSINGNGFLEVYPHEALQNMSKSIVGYRGSTEELAEDQRKQRRWRVPRERPIRGGYQLFHQDDLPQQFTGQPNSYVLTGGQAKITLSNVKSQLEESKKFGRSGFFESRHFGQSHGYQDFDFRLKAVNSTTPTVFHLDFQTVPLVYKDELRVTVYKGDDWRTTVYNNKKPTNGSLEVTGDYCQVSYNPQGGIQNGSLIRYTVTQQKLTVGLSGIFSFVLVALNLLVFH
ncbi:unnamed protein product [Caenorhabditis nigoni]